MLHGDGCLDMWTMVAAIATATDHVALGPLVLNVTTRHPAHIATAAATVQALSGGRLQLGLGAGASRPSPFAAEMDMFRLPQEGAPRRRERLIETIGFLRALWAGARSFDGEWASFADVAAVSYPQPPCPIVVGANGPKMAAVAGAYAEGLNLHSWERDLAGLIGTAHDAVAARGGPSLTLSVECPWEPAWLDPASASRRVLTDLGVTEIVVRWSAAMGLDPIRRASGLLR